MRVDGEGLHRRSLASGGRPRRAATPPDGWSPANAGPNHTSGASPSMPGGELRGDQGVDLRTLLQSSPDGDLQLQGGDDRGDSGF